MPTGPAGTPQPTTASDLQSALNNSPEQGLVILDPSATYQASDTIDVPETVSIEGNGATVTATRGGAAFDLGREAEIYNIDIDLGSGGGTGVRNVATSYNQKRPTGAYGVRVVASGGNGSTGLIHGLSSDGRNFYQNYTIECDGVDNPLSIKAFDADSSAFGTGNTFTIKASNFVTAIRVDSDTRRCGFGNSHVHVDLSPSGRSERVLDYQDTWGKDFVVSGWFGSPSSYNSALSVIRDTRKDDRGGHNLISYEGLDDDSLIDNRIGADDCYVVPFEVSRQQYAAERLAPPAAASTATSGIVPVSPGSVQADLQTAADQGVLARVENGATLDPGIELPAGVVCDARGATMDGDGTSPMVSYNSGATLWGLTTTFDEGEVNGPVHSIRATGGATIDGGGPMNCYAEGGSGDPDVTPVSVEANGGTITNVRACVRSIDTNGGLDIESTNGGTVRNCHFAGAHDQSLNGIQVLGDSTIEDCIINTQVQPVADESVRMLYVDNPSARRITYEGILWDQFRMDQSGQWAGVWIDDADGLIRRLNYGIDDENKGGPDAKYYNWIDRTGDDSNGLIPIATFDSGDRASRNITAQRFELSRYLSASGLAGSSLEALPRSLAIENTSGSRGSYEFTVSGDAELQTGDGSGS